MLAGYTAQKDPETTARAIGKDINMSPKKAVEVCRAIRGMMVSDAKEYLEDVIDMKRAVPYYRYRMGTSRKKGVHTFGGYPVRVSKAILKVLEGAEANAEHKELDPDDMKVTVIAAHRGRVMKNYMPRAHGRATPFFRQLTNIEVILETVEEE